ncbi:MULTISPECIES: ArsR family transcriptional regulator [unclassified Streptomyces]|uniref:ArsR/SmtB family transcription factor n=1 Tax=unclassified Streptomyces TaxID=2593676 RepID=UPI0006F95C99|nr:MULTISPECIES: ArsR family transcriptional regulator [unclassified Streptomyces]KQX56971.1 ArsR family transcriptional regulator [Streptomyces sp. Root1304]KRA98552.1 ArsR family transcriptional regulator [Streptomyces sp. Root66D1]
MGWWQIGTDSLAGSRFVVSPLAETVAALKTLHAAVGAHPGERAWLTAHLPAYRARLAAEPLDALLVRAAIGPTWNADFLTPTPTGDRDRSFEEEVEAVRVVEPADAVPQLEVAVGGPVPEPLRSARDLPHRLAGVLEWVWRETVLPDWPRRRRVLEADVVARTAQLARDGWAAALDELCPGKMRWLGDGRLQVNPRAYPPRRFDDGRLLFVPVTPNKGWVSWEGSERSAIVYACSGALRDATVPVVPEALGALLGGARAGVLVRLESPKSTSQLVALTGQGLGSVGRHLKVLLDAGLVRRGRAGRSVLYEWTEAGGVLVRAQGRAAST